MQDVNINAYISFFAYNVFKFCRFQKYLLQVNIKGAYSLFSLRVRIKDLKALRGSC